MVNQSTSALPQSNLYKYFLHVGYTFTTPPLKCKSSIRYDLTSAAQSHLHQPPSGLSFKHGLVERNERHTDFGRHLIFEQFDIDVLDVLSLVVELVVVLPAASAMLNLFSISTHVNLVLGNSLVPLALSEICGLLRCSSKRNSLLTALDKASTLPTQELLKLVSEGRRDISGDFITGPGIVIPTKLSAHTSQIKSSFASEPLTSLNATYLSLIGSRLGETGLKELLWLRYAQQAIGSHYSTVINPLLNRGASYYNGPIFEAISNVVCINERNQFVKIGSLIGGGRYDGFYKADSLRYSAGCSLGLTRVCDFINALRKSFDPPSPHHLSIYLNQTDCCFSYLASLFAVLTAHHLTFTLTANDSVHGALATCDHRSTILIKVKGGWLFKDLRRRSHFQSKVTSAASWRHLFPNLSWTSEPALLQTLHNLRSPRHDRAFRRIDSQK
ncbi:MAG: hypothetical protein ACKER6_01175 [Candidatus Hodgkinia cicadicola]